MVARGPSCPCCAKPSDWINGDAEIRVVSRRVDAIGEILENNVNGLAINPFSSEVLAVALRQLMTQPNLRQQFGIAAREKVLTQLAPAIEQQNWERVYQQALNIAQPVMLPR